MAMIYCKPTIINDSSSNGGIKTSTEIIELKKNELFPDISEAEAEAGITRYRKFFAVNGVIYDTVKVLVLPSPGGDGIFINSGTTIDTQLQAALYTGWKGSGFLKEALSEGHITSLVVETELPGLGIQAGDLIRIANSNSEDYLRIQSVSWDGSEVTITPVNYQSLITSNYQIGDYVSACLEFGNITTQSFWIKEIVPPSCNPYFYNLIKILLKGRRDIWA